MRVRARNKEQDSLILDQRRLDQRSYVVVSFVCLTCHLFLGKNITINKVFSLTCGSYFLWSDLLFSYSDVRHTRQRVDDSFLCTKFFQVVILRLRNIFYKLKWKMALFCRIQPVLLSVSLFIGYTVKVVSFMIQWSVLPVKTVGRQTCLSQCDGSMSTQTSFTYCFQGNVCFWFKEIRFIIIFFTSLQLFLLAFSVKEKKD